MGEMELKEAMSDDVRLQTSLPKVTVTATTLITIKNRCNFSHLPRFPSRWYGVLLFTFPPWPNLTSKQANGAKIVQPRTSPCAVTASCSEIYERRLARLI